MAAAIELRSRGLLDRLGMLPLYGSRSTDHRAGLFKLTHFRRFKRPESAHRSVADFHRLEETKEAVLPEKTHEQLVAEANARLDKLHKHVQQVLAGIIPEDAPADFVLTPEMQAAPTPWWIDNEAAARADVVLEVGPDGELTQE